MQAKITTTLQIDGLPDALSAYEMVHCDDKYDKNFAVKAGETKTFPLLIQLAITVSLVLVAGQRMRVKLGKIDREFQEGEPLIWTKGSGLAGPLVQDTAEITVTNLSDKSGTLFVRVFELNSPPEVAAAATPTKLPDQAQGDPKGPKA